MPVQVEGSGTARLVGSRTMAVPSERNEMLSRTNELMWTVWLTRDGAVVGDVYVFRFRAYP
jgi:hypothetical protein